VSNFDLSQDLLNAYRTIHTTIRRRSAQDASTEALKTAAIAILTEASREGATPDQVNQVLRETTAQQVRVYQDDFLF